MNSKKTAWTVCAAVAVALAAQLASADPLRPDEGRRFDAPRPGFTHYDAHFGHNQYYPARGFVVRGLPAGYVTVVRGPNRFFFAGGVWYAARGPGFVVVGPPIGVFVPVLPPFYTTVWVGGFPYYYANDTYYDWNPGQNAYEVVAPPDGAEPPAGDGGAPPPGGPPPGPMGGPPGPMGAPPGPAGGPPGDVFVYPANGQSPEQQAQDKYECHKWAVGQSGFDPTQAGGGVPGGDNGARRSDYRRALGACLAGRGYSVK
jgi:hypothetical protein